MAGKNNGDLQHDNTSNKLTDDETYALTLQHKKKYESALAAKKKTAADFLNVTKLAKAELGDTALKDIKDLIAAEEEGFDEKFQAELERQARIARWAGIEVGEQTDLFDFGAVKPGVAERAFNEGKRAGLAGELCKPPFDGGSDGHNEYVRGWHSGQATNLSMIKKKDAEEVPLIVNEDREVASVDEFDEAADGDNFGEDDAEVETEAEPSVDAEETPWPDDKEVSAREPAETL